MLTVGQVINLFVSWLEQQGQSRRNITCLYRIICRQFLWEVFCLISRHDFPTDYIPTHVQEDKSPGTLAGYKRYWQLFHGFLKSSLVNYLTMGDAVKDFLDSFKDAGHAPQTCCMAQSNIKLLGREYAKNLPLSFIDGRITTTIWQRGNQRSIYARHGISRFMRYLQEHGYVSCKLYQRYEPKWKREIQALVGSCKPNLNQESLLTECLGPYFSYCIDAKNQTDEGLKSTYAQLIFFSRWLGPGEISSVNLDLVEKFLVYLQEERKNSLSAMKSAAVALKSFCFFLGEEGILPDNPLAQLRVKQPQVLSRTVLNSEELTMLLTAVRQLENKNWSGSTERIKQFLGFRNVAILETLAHTGIRAGELGGLTVNRVNLKRGYLDIIGKGSVRHYKKERRVYIESEQTMQALVDYMAVRPDELGSLLFTTKNGNPLKPYDINKILLRCTKAAGISKHITCHDLRATFASLLTAGGVDPLTLKVLMGHDNLSTTLKSYVSLEQEQLREVWKKCNPLANLPPRNGGVE